MYFTYSILLSTNDSDDMLFHYIPLYSESSTRYQVHGTAARMHDNMPIAINCFSSSGVPLKYIELQYWRAQQYQNVVVSTLTIYQYIGPIIRSWSTKLYTTFIWSDALNPGRGQKSEPNRTSWTIYCHIYCT